MKIALVGNFTLDFIARAIGKKILRHDRRNPEVLYGQFDQWQIELRDAGSFLYREKPDALFVLLDPERLLDAGAAFSKADAACEHNVDCVIDECVAVCADARRRIGNPALFISNFYAKQQSPYRLLEYNQPYSREAIIDHANLVLSQKARSAGLFVFDCRALIDRHGYEAIFDRKYDYLAKSPFSEMGLDLLADHIIRYLDALRGPARKCIVLDFDNTLWGGIIGEDGIERILLSNDGQGKAFYDFQRELLNLRSQGFLLAACSRNNPEDVLEALKKHPHCLLKPEHFSCMRVNWDDKASNLIRIAEELNLGLNSLVFIDDDPRECELVSQSLPEIKVVRLPSDYSKYSALILSLDDFNVLRLTAEDRERPELYAQEKKRECLKKTSLSLEDYYRSLQIRLTIARASDSEIPRIAQLTQRTNQFNLTTRRYTEQQIGEFIHSGNNLVFSLHAADRFGDSGLVGVAIVKITGDMAELDSFLLSCRILGRAIESAFLHEICGYLSRQGIRSLLAYYIATPKNQVAQDFLVREKFKMAGDGKFQLDPVSPSKRPGWIQIAEGV